MTERLKANSIHKARNIHGEAYWVKIIKHEPSIEMCTCRVIEQPDYPKAEHWNFAKYAVCIATDHADIVNANRNLQRLGTMFETVKTPRRVLEFFLEELTRARTTFTDLIYGEDKLTYPPINLIKGFELYKIAREVAALGTYNR